MFNLSWAETFVILVVALLVIKPQDIPVIVKHVRGFIRKCKEIQQEISRSVNEVIDQPEIRDLKKEVEDVNKEIEYIVDREGKLQPTYDISDLLEEKKQQHTTQPPEIKAP